MVELNNISKKYGKTEVLENVTVTFENNKIIGLFGENGSGKTMLMKMICGLVKPTSGVITVDGKQIGKDTDFPESVGIMIETPSFVPWQTGYEYLKELAMLKKKIGDDRINETLEIVGLSGVTKTIGKYSLGMKQRLAIAQAIMEEPALLLLDEPFNSVDKKGVSELLQVISSMKSPGRTIIISGHREEEVRSMCDEVYEMEVFRNHGKCECKHTVYK